MKMDMDMETINPATFEQIYFPLGKGRVGELWER